MEAKRVFQDITLLQFKLMPGGKPIGDLLAHYASVIQALSPICPLGESVHAIIVPVFRGRRSIRPDRCGTNLDLVQ